MIYAHGRLLPHQLKQEPVPASVARTRTSRWARGQSRTETKGSEGRQGRQGSEGRRRLPSVIGGVPTAHVPDDSYKMRSVGGSLENMTETFAQSLEQKTLHASKLKTGASPRLLLTPGPCIAVIMRRRARNAFINSICFLSLPVCRTPAGGEIQRIN